MARALRTSLPDGLFHVYCRSVEGVPAFTDDRDRSAFTELFWQCARRYRWTCYTACVLSTHYHAVLAAAREDLSYGMQRLNSSYARAFNKRHDRFGHVFAERFGSRVVEREEYLYETCAYVLLNPVKAGLCDRVEDWPWSFSRYGLRNT